MQQDLSQCRIWLTGASSGIGAALALELSKAGAKVALSARNVTGLETVANQMPKDQVLIVPCDVTHLLQNKQAVETIVAAWGGIDIVILNAGSCQYLDSKHFDSRVFETMITTNYLSQVYGIEAALPYLRKSLNPHIVGMSSTAAYLGLPRGEAYSASKAAIKNMLEGLRIDLMPEKIAVSIICPGFVKTPLTDKNDFSMPTIISAEQAAIEICKGIKNFQHEIYFPKKISLILKFLACLPTAITAPFLAKRTKK
jgi:NADP-dependent 3-hydroxy acid dehydrogenase YdfG